MLDISLIMLGAGESARFGLPVKKQWLRVGDEPLWLMATKNLSEFYKFKEIFIASTMDEYMAKFAPNFSFVKGGASRQESLKNALEFVKSEFVLVSDIARPCISRELFMRIIDNTDGADCVIPALNVADTAYLADNVIDRNQVRLIQTPQFSRTKLLKEALKTEKIYTDDSSALKAVGGKIRYILGDERAKKITNLGDLALLSCLKAPSGEQFIGSGFDVHSFKEGDFITLCGEKIAHNRAFKAHSDGDVATHALIDAIFGAAGLGDIGEHFPDTSAEFKGINSLELLKRAYKLTQSVGFELVNADITIMAERPKISKFKSKMEQNIANVLNLAHNRVNVKATTTEALGFIGRGEGIAASASVSLKYLDWSKWL